MKYDIERIDAIRRTWLTPNWIPGKEFHQVAARDVNYLIDVVHELTVKIAEIQNKVTFKEFL
jgi:hypothetical protein